MCARLNFLSDAEEKEEERRRGKEENRKKTEAMMIIEMGIFEMWYKRCVKIRCDIPQMARMTMMMKIRRCGCR